MKYEGLDWVKLKLPAFGFGVVFGLSVAIVIASAYFKQNMFLEYTRHKEQLDTVSAAYLKIDEDERAARRYYPKIAELENEGLIGGENRLNWIETLLAAKEHLNLSDVKYAISPQRQYHPGFEIDLNPITLHSSAMELDMKVLHEGDIREFLRYMNREAQGLFTIDKCTFTRLRRDAFDGVEAAANIGIACRLQWFNFRAGDGGEVEL